jgi:hypothetical protein
MYMFEKYKRKAEIVSKASEFMSFPFALAFADGYLFLEYHVPDGVAKLDEAIQLALEVIGKENMKEPEQLVIYMLHQYYEERYKN